MANLIMASVADKNGHLYLDCSPLNLVPINCDLVTGGWNGWLLPNATGDAYEFFTGGNQSAVPGAVEVFRVQQGNDTFTLLGNMTDFETACNACCDASPSGSPVPHDAVPALTFMAPPHYLVNDPLCVPYFYGKLPANGGTPYTVSFYCGGTLVQTTTSSATAATHRTALAGGAAGAYGTWTLGAGNLLTLASDGNPACESAAIRVNP